MDLYDSAVESAADQSAAGTKASVIGTTDQLFFTTLTVDASRTLAWIKANTKIEPILMKEYYEIYEIQSGGQNTAAAGTGKFNG
jgi:hypothetical protein